MTIPAQILADWQKCCERLQQASDIVDRNMDSINRPHYLSLYRYAVRQCEQAERRM